MSVKRKQLLFFPSIVPLVVVCIFLITGSVIGGEQQTLSVTDASAAAAGETGLAATTAFSSSPTTTSSSTAGDTVFASFDAASSGAPAANPPAATPGDPADPGLPLVPDADAGYQMTGGLSISGRVTDPWGRGIPNIEVEAKSLIGAALPPQLFTTDANGYYRIDADDPGLVKLHFSQNQYSPDYKAAHGMQPWADEWYNNQPTEDTAEAVPTGASGVDAVLTPTGTLHGHLDFPHPSSVTVVAFRADRQEEVGFSNASPMTATPNDFYFTSLPPGNYKLLLIPSDAAGATSTGPSGSTGGVTGPFWYQGAGSWDTAATVQVSAGQSTDLQVDFPSAASGSVFGALFVNRYSYSPSSVITLVDAADGNKVISEVHNLPDYPYQGSGSYFQFDNVAFGEYKLKCTLPDGHVLWYTGDANGSSEDFSAAMTLNVTQDNPSAGFLYFQANTINAAVEGHVVRPDGSSVTDRTVYAKKISASGDSLAFAFRTDTHGEFSGQVSPGTYKFCTEDWDTRDEYCGDTLTLGWHESVSGITITMPLDTVSPAIVEGRVLKPDGTAVPWSEVHVLSLDTGVDYTTSWIYPPGDFSFEVPAGTYRIFVSNQGSEYTYSDGKPVTLKNGELLKTANIMVPQNFDTPGKVSGHVYGAGVKAVPGAVITGTPLSTMEGNSPVQTVADADGNYTLNLKPGWWRACAANAYGSQSCSDSFMVSWNDVQAGHDIRIGSVIETGEVQSLAQQGSSAAAGQAADESGQAAHTATGSGNPAASGAPGTDSSTPGTTGAGADTGSSTSSAGGNTTAGSGATGSAAGSTDSAGTGTTVIRPNPPSTTLKPACSQPKSSPSTATGKVSS